MFKLVFLALAFSALPSLAAAQTAAPAAAETPVNTPPGLADGRLAPGQTFVDSLGRRIENSGLTNGGVSIRYTGRVTRNGNTFTTDGEVVKVTVPASNGTDGLTVDTNGQPTEINIERSGQASNPNNITIIGGNAHVTVGGNFNDLSIGGTGNTARVTGNNNNGTGQPGSSGSVFLGGARNSWVGGNWVVRN